MCDLPLLIGGDYEDRDPRSVWADKPRSLRSGRVAGVVDDDSETVEVGEAPLADQRGVLPDPGGEHHRVHTTEGRVVRTDVAAEAVAVDVEREGRVGVPGLGAGDD